MNKKIIIVLSIILAFLVIIIVVPLLVALAINISLVVTDTSNGWIGFWGSYLGDIVGSDATIGGVALTLYYQRKKDEADELVKEKERVEKRRLELIPYMKASYCIPKSLKDFGEKEVYYVDFTLKSPVIRNYMNSRTEKIVSDLSLSAQYYILNYNVCNIGTGSAANLFITVGDLKVVRNGAICPNEKIILNFLFKIDDLKKKEIEIVFEYTDVIDDGHYKQKQVLLFETTEDEIGLKNQEPLSKPEIIGK